MLTMVASLIATGWGISLKQRYVELDALRGIAATVVVLRHFLNVFPRETHPAIDLLLKSPLRIFFAAHEAVLLFFLLSGFVLALSLNGRQVPYPIFVAKRIARIWLPYLAALGLAVMGAAFLNGPVAGTSAWFAQTWATAPDIATIIGHIVLIDRFDVVALNTAFWSLTYEMRISLIFPLLLIFAAGGLRAVGAMAVAGVAIATFGRSSPYQADWLITFHYAAIFLLGAWMAIHAGKLIALSQSINGRARVAVTAFALMLVIYGGAPRGRLELVGDWAIVAGLAWFMIQGLAHVRSSDWLCSPLPQYLGRISYSLYLVHGTILFALVHILAPQIGLAAILPIYLAASFALADGFHRMIEAPAMRLSQRITVRRPQLA